MAGKKPHNHYFKSVKGLEDIDVYRVLQLFNVTDPAIQHALKKLLVAGGRGAGKDISRDIQEAIDSLERWQEMRHEEQLASESKTAHLAHGMTPLPTIKSIGDCLVPRCVTAQRCMRRVGESCGAVPMIPSPPECFYSSGCTSVSDCITKNCCQAHRV